MEGGCFLVDWLAGGDHPWSTGERTAEAPGSSQHRPIQHRSRCGEKSDIFESWQYCSFLIMLIKRAYWRAWCHVWIRQVSIPTTGWRPGWHWLCLESGKDWLLSTNSPPGTAHVWHLHDETRYPDFFLWNPIKSSQKNTVSFITVQCADPAHYKKRLFKFKACLWRMIMENVQQRCWDRRWFRWDLLNSVSLVSSVSVLWLPRCRFQLSPGPGWLRLDWWRSF